MAVKVVLLVEIGAASEVVCQCGGCCICVDRVDVGCCARGDVWQVIKGPGVIPYVEGSCPVAACRIAERRMDIAAGVTEVDFVQDYVVLHKADVGPLVIEALIDEILGPLVTN